MSELVPLKHHKCPLWSEILMVDGTWSRYVSKFRYVALGAVLKIHASWYTPVISEWGIYCVIVVIYPVSLQYYKQYLKH